MVRCPYMEWEQKQILDMKCNFFLPLWEDAALALPDIAAVVPIVGGCAISRRDMESICMGKKYCPFWKVSRVHVDAIG